MTIANRYFEANESRAPSSAALARLSVDATIRVSASSRPIGMSSRRASVSIRKAISPRITVAPAVPMISVPMPRSSIVVATRSHRPDPR